MKKNSSVVSGRIVIDDFHERFFLFVSASTHLTLDGKIVSAGSLPATDPEFMGRLREGLRLDNRRTFPIGIDSDHSGVVGFRIVRLLDDGSVVFPQDFPGALEHQGDSSRAVTVGGHIATNEEMRSHGHLTNPTITVEKLVTFEAIQQSAFDMFKSGQAGSAFDQWLRAERELLAIT